MSKRILIIFALALVLVTGFIIFFLSGGDVESFSKKKNQAKIYDNWEESYKIEESNATGVSLFNELLEYRTKKTSVIIEEKIDSLALSDTNTTYIFIGNEFQLKTEEFDSIISRVYAGSNLFLAYKGISSNIFDFFFENSGFLWHFSEYVDVYTDTNLRMHTVFQGDTVAIKWNYFPFSKLKFEENEHISSINSLSEIDIYSNFLDIQIGSGHVFLHSNPELFQNYQLLSKNGYKHAEFVVQNIPENHTLKWLEIGRFTDDGSEFNGEDENSSGERDNSYLQFIFNNKSLTLALLVAILGIILFLIFRTKRSKPIVPYIPKTGNQALSFAETIKEIYFKQQTPFSILQVMKKNFYTAVNKQFFIDISKKEDQQNGVKHLSEKTGISLENISNIISKLETKERLSVDYNYLEETAQLQQQFYTQTGIIKASLKTKIEAKSKKFNRKIALSITLLCVGIASILTGFYLLHKAEGLGITFWPLGIIIASLGARLLALPLLEVTGNELVFYFIFSKAHTINIIDIQQIYVENNISHFLTVEGKRFTINHSEMSKYDKQSYEQFIFPLINKKL